MNLHARALFCVVLLGACAASSDNPEAIALGMVNCQTVRAAKAYGEQVSIVPGVIVRFMRKASGGESFALSNDAGIAVVPLRPGEYCYDVYDQRGQPLPLNPKKDNCFELKAGETKTVGVGLAPQ